MIGSNVDVLLIEDDAVIAAMYATRLRADGWVVSVVEDGLRGLQATWRDRPRLVLLDVRLPRLDGLTVLEHLAQRSVFAPPVIMLSNSNSPEVVQRALSCGAREFLVKCSTTPAQLASRVAEVLGGGDRYPTLQAEGPFEAALC